MRLVGSQVRRLVGIVAHHCRTSIGGRRRAIEVDRQPVSVGDPLRRLAGQCNRLLDTDAAIGDERQHVDRTDPGVHTLVGRDVDQPERHVRHLDRRVAHRHRLADEADHRAVVVFVDVPVKHPHPWNRFDRLENRIERLGVTSLGEVGDALDELRGVAHSRSKITWPALTTVRTWFSP